VQDNELFVTGRRKELIIIRGRNYYPKDIETTVETAHAALRPGAGAAFAITIEGQERLVIVQEVERTQLRNLDGEAVAQAVRRAIAEQHELQLYGLQLIKTGSMPKTSSGKIQRLHCRAGYLDHQLDAVYTWQATLAESWVELDGEASLASEGITNGDRSPAMVPPLPPPAKSPKALEQWLATWLAQALQLPLAEIDVTRPFADYGLDSVAAVELTEALQTVLQQPLSPTLAYEYPTIEAVAAYLGAQWEPSDAVPPAPPQSATEDEDLAELLTALEGLSEAEMEELLGQQGR
jgi:acyl carrier protein